MAKETVGSDRLEEHLLHFAGQLRQEGLPMGTVELLDALQALQKIDLSRRSAFKTALEATMVKSCRHREIFDALFERYFVTDEARAEQRRRAARREESLRLKSREAERELRFKGEPLTLTAGEIILFTALPAEQRKRLVRFVRETETGNKVEPSFRPLLESVVKGHLRYWHDRMDREGKRPDLHPGGGGGNGSAGSRGGGLKDVDIRDISEADLPRAEALLNMLSQQLARKLLRRYRSVSRRAPLDLRRSIRANMRFGGSIFVLRYRKKRRSRQRLLLLCDISASMQRYSTFVLQFIYGLQATAPNLETFCFADNLEHISPDLKLRGNMKKVLERVVLKSKTWGGGTNLAAALRTLLERYQPLLDRRTTAIIVSDTKTMELEPSLQALQKLKERVWRVVWLNTLPPARWPDHRSVRAIRELVEMRPCNTIAQLEQVIAGRLLRPAEYNH